MTYNSIPVEDGKTKYISDMIYLPEQTNYDDASSVGYFLYSETLQAELTGGIKRLSLPQLSAFGLILTFIIAPLTLIIKKALEKFGPSVE